MSIGEVLEARLLELGMSQADAATELDVTQATVNRWINGTSTPEIGRAQALARFCEITERQAETAINLQKKQTERPTVEVLRTLAAEVRALADRVAALERSQADRHEP